MRMESTLRRAAVASRQFPKMPSFPVHGSQGPSSRHFLSTKDKAALKNSKTGPLMKTFITTPNKSSHEHLGAALFDMRKRLSRVVSHGANIQDHLLKAFGFQPVTGFWVLEDTPTGAWIITNPKKGNIKFVHDEYDEYGRLKTVAPDPIWEVLTSHQQYADLLREACRFVASFREDYGIKPALPDTAAKGAAKAVPMTREEKRLRASLEKEMARRTAEREARLKSTKAPVIPDLGMRRYRAWLERRGAGIRETPALTYEKKQKMIETAWQLLKDSNASHQQKPGWFESLELRIVEKDA